MATDIKKIIPSGSTNGRPVKIAATATPGTIIHQSATTTVTGCGDTMIASVYNSDTVDRSITFECGGTSSPDDHVKRTIPSGETFNVPLPMLNNNLILRAFASAANVLTVSGYVERITVS